MATSIVSNPFSDNEPKPAGCFFVLICIIICICVSWCTNYEKDAFEDFTLMEIKGVVLNKYKDPVKNYHPYVVLRSESDSMIKHTYPFDWIRDFSQTMGIYDSLKVGDTILKEKGSTKFYIKRKDKILEFEPILDEED